MNRYDRRSVALAVSLSFLAGYVDSLGFLQTGGFFLSFMSGNSTRFGVGIGTGTTAQAAAAGGIIVTFLLGVIFGALVGHFAKANRRPAVLFAETMLLTLAALLHDGGFDLMALGATIMAMGIENSVFWRDGEVSIGLTYMTGTLVKMGQRIAGALVGGSRFGWVPYLVLWVGLVCGGMSGAAVFRSVGFDGLWFAVCLAALLSVIVTLDRTGLRHAG